MVTPPSESVGGRSASIPLNVVRIARDVAITLALLLLNMGGNAGAGAFFAILAVMVLRGPVSAYKALALCYLGLMINVAFVPKSLVWTPSRLALPMLAFVRFAIDFAGTRRSANGRATYVAFLAYVATMALCSVLSGWMTHISLLKLFNFWMCITAVFLGVAVLRARRVDIAEWFVSLIISAGALGLLAIATGNSRNFSRGRLGDLLVGDGFFNGAFLHPNLHAIYASMFVVFPLTVFLFTRYRNRIILLPLAGLWVTFILYSQSRTAVFATLAPVLILVAYATPRTLRDGRWFAPNLRRSTLVGLLVMALIGGGIFDVASGRRITKTIVGFLHKSDGEASVNLDTTQLLNSRQSIIESSWNTFLEQPLHGIGFQLLKTEEFARNATIFSAPAEKGFLPTAVLEEGGVLGATAFVVLLLTMTATFIRERNVPALAIFLCFLVSNIGEVTIFSPGGAGAFGWIMVGAGMMLGDHCWTRSHGPVAGFSRPRWPVSSPVRSSPLGPVPLGGGNVAR